MDEGERDEFVPKDKYNIVYWSTFFIGLSVLFPWNILITVTGYWNYKLRNVSLDNVGVNETEGAPTLTELQKLYNSYLSIASNIPNTTFVILHAVVGHRFNMNLKLFASQVFMVVILGFVAVFSFLDSDEWQEEFLNVNLGCIAFLNVFIAIFQAAAASLFGTFPANYIGTMSSGAGMGGLIPSLVNVLIIGVVQKQSNQSAVGSVCFVISTIIAILALINTAFLVMGNRFFRHFSGEAGKQTKNAPMANGQPEAQTNDEKSSLAKDAKIFYAVTKQAGIYLLAILINFTTTLVVFPAVTALIKPEHKEGAVMSDWEELYFVPVCCFVLFNLADYIGKELAIKFQRPRPTKSGQWVLLSFAAIRMAFIPLLIFCNVAPGNRNTEVLFVSEWWYVAFMALFGFSNGYIGNIAFMFAPKVVHNHYQRIAGAFAIAVLVLGCGAGSIISRPVVELL